MSRLIFMLEEPSMRVFLDALLPRVFPELDFQCIAHEGKSDLEKSLPRKLRSWQQAGDRFVVLRDNDRGDCKTLKATLVDICRQAGRPDALVRIVCQELEAWYFGDPAAMAAAFDNPRLSRINQRAKYRDPDAIDYPARELIALHPGFQKLDGARRIVPQLTIGTNRSRSFHALLEGVARVSGHPLPV